MSKLIMMIGLPASGKSTYARELCIKENAILISSDDMRQELYGDIDNQDDKSNLFQEIHRRIKNNLKQGNNVVYDATNISWKKRRQLLWDIKKINVIKECYFMATPYEICLKQNENRERKIPKHVIKRMYENIYIPQYYEGWNKINIIYNKQDMKFNVFDLFYGENGLVKINQDNPHHTLTIGEHCLKCREVCGDLKYSFILHVSALYHDIGKSFTKQFKNAKGEDSKIAHYYNHQLISAYESLFYLDYLKEESLLEVVKYITWHMQPFFMQTEKSKKKFINLVGEDFYDNLLILHKADIMAK